MDLLYTIYCSSDIFFAAMSAVCGALCFYRAQKHVKNRTFFILIGGFFSCLFLCGIFFVLVWLVIDYPFIISPGDLSWAGAIIFLITAEMGLMDA